MIKNVLMIVNVLKKTLNDLTFSFFFFFCSAVQIVGQQKG